METILTSDHEHAKNARSLFYVHGVLQGILLTTALLEMRVLFYITFIIFIFTTVKIIIYGIKLKQ